MKTFQCVDCGETKEIMPGSSRGPGYTVRPPPYQPNQPTDPQWPLTSWGRPGKVCYDCCSKHDLAYMKREGKIVLYITERRSVDINGELQRTPTRITNWPESLSFPVNRYHYSDHNMTGPNGRLDVWFHHDGHTWHGVNIGDNMILRCKRTQEKA